MCIHMLEQARLNLELGLNVHNKSCQIHMLFLLGDYRLSPLYRLVVLKRPMFEIRCCVHFLD